MSKNKQKIDSLKQKGDEAMKSGNFKKALKDYTYALQMDGENLTLLEKKIKCLNKLEQYDLALVDADRHLQIKESTDGYALKAQSLYNMKQYKRADTFVKKGLEINDKHTLLQKLNKEVSVYAYVDPELSKKHKAQGVDKLKQGLFSDSLTEFSEAIKRLARDAPQDEALYVGLGDSQIGLGDWDSAVKSYQAALKINPSLARPLFIIGQHFLKKKEDLKGLESIRQSLKLEQDKDRQEFYDGICKSKNDEALKLIVDAREFLKSDPAFAIGTFFKAFQLYQQSGSRSGEEKALGYMAAAYTHNKDFPRSIHYYAESIKICKELNDVEGEAYYWNNIGSLYFTMGDSETALQNFERAFEIQKRIDKVDESILRNISTTATALGKIDKAIEVCELVLKRNPKDINAYYSLGVCYRQQNKIDKEIECYQKLLSIQPSIRAHNSLGVCYENMGSIDKALDHLEKALELSEQLGDENGQVLALNNLANCYYKAGKVQKALDTFEKVQILAKKLSHQPILDAVTKSLNMIGNQMKTDMKK